EGGRRSRALGHTSRAEVVPIVIADVLIDSIWRGLRLHGALVRQWTTENHKPLVRPRPFPLQTRLYAAFDHLDFHGAFLTIAHCQASPGSRAERLAPPTHRLPRGLGATSTPVIWGQRGLQITNGGGAGHPEHIPLAPLPQRLTKPRVAPQLIVTRHPAVRHLRPPQVEHRQALLVPRLIAHLRRDMALHTPLLILGPVLGQGQAEVEQGIVVTRDVPHEDADLTVVDLAPVATPVALDPHRGRPAFGKTARIEGDDALGVP